MTVNLVTLAQAPNQGGFGMFGNKLKIDSNGVFSFVHGVKAAKIRTKADSFSDKNVQQRIYNEFNTALNNIPDSPLQDATLTSLDLVLNAFRGYAHIKSYYKILKQDSLSNAQNEIRRLIKTKILTILKANSNHYWGDLGTQSAILPKVDTLDNNGLQTTQIDILNGGICYGISVKWCSRWLKNKRGFGVAKNMNDDLLIRLRAKTPEMFLLMHNQSKLVDHGGYLADALDRGNSTNITRVNYGPRTLSHNEAAEAAHNTFTKGRTHEIFINSIQAKENKNRMNNAYIEKAVFFKTKFENSRFLGPLDQRVAFLEGDILTQLDDCEMVNYPQACLIGWLTKDKKGGHALAGSAKDGTYIFMDPNFGEWHLNRQNMSIILRMIICLYFLNYSPFHWLSQNVIQKSDTLPQKPSLLPRQMI